MSRYSTRLASAAFALSVVTASAAMAQTPPKDDAPPAAKAEPHKAEPHKTVTHKTAVVHQKVDRTVNVQRNVHVNEHVQKTVVTHAVPGHVEPARVEPARPIVAGPAPARWGRGAAFTGERRAFTDYDRYHVRRPPAGYEWVQDGNELVLINIGSGIIDDTFVISIP